MVAAAASQRAAFKGLSLQKRLLLALLLAAGALGLCSVRVLRHSPALAAESWPPASALQLRAAAAPLRTEAPGREATGPQLHDAAAPPVAEGDAGPSTLPPDGPEVAGNSTGLVMDGIVVKELPEFWRPPEGADLDAPGPEVEGQPTIFVGIASYRDVLCHNTIHEALRWADHPRRLTFGVVEQNSPDEADELRCDYTDKPCSEDPSQLLCAHRSQLRLLRVSARDARGPCFGRHRSERLYRGEHFALQLDAHMYFVKGWDTKIIAQWRETRNEYAVLSTYPSDYFEKSVSATGEGLKGTTPLICSSQIGHDGMVRHDAAGEIEPSEAIVGKSPILGPLWGAGISFSRGHRILRVPYDCCLDMMFVGEEFSMAVRMWTHGYDFYAPFRSVAFHPYARPKPPAMFWENSHLAPDAAARSARRVMALLGYPPEAGTYDASGLGVGGRYGLGSRRPLELFMRLFGYDIKKRKVRNNCPWVLRMSMHKELVPFLRKDGKGIDYSRVPVEELLKRHFPTLTGRKECDYGGPSSGFLADCAQDCHRFDSLRKAKEACSQDDSCTGVVQGGSSFELRAGRQLYPSPVGETSYTKGGCRAAAAA